MNLCGTPHPHLKYLSGAPGINIFVCVCFFFKPIVVLGNRVARIYHQSLMDIEGNALSYCLMTCCWQICKFIYKEKLNKLPF